MSNTLLKQRLDTCFNIDNVAVYDMLIHFDYNGYYCCISRVNYCFKQLDVPDIRVEDLSTFIGVLNFIKNFDWEKC